MSVSNPPVVVDASGARTLLADLCGPFANGFVPDCSAVQPQDIPFPQDDLLVHHDHMTEVLQRHHGGPVKVHVLAERLDGDSYTRKISLTPEAGDKVVEWGVVRLNFRYMPEAVKREILEKRTPLGAILIKHDVHRRIKPRYFLRLPPDSSVLQMFGTRATGPVYGRLGTIYCDDEPCIEVLEIVVNT